MRNCRIFSIDGQCNYLPGDDSGSGNGSLEVEPSDDVLKEIKVAHTVLKRGRPKGAKLTVIGLPKKKSRKGVIPFTKLPAAEKDRLLLECFIVQNTANKVIKSGKIVDIEDINSNLREIPDMVMDKYSADIYRIQKLFNKNMWDFLLSVLEKKKMQPALCIVCTTFINDEDTFIRCARCLAQIHLSCSPLQKKLKKSNYICSSCFSKYNL